MQMADSDVEARACRVQELCAQLSRLVTLSQDQRRKIDNLLMQLEAIARETNDRKHVRARRSDLPGR